MQTVADLQALLADTLWGRKAAKKGLDARALARPMARILFLKTRGLHRVAIGIELGLEPRRVYQLEQRACRLLAEEQRERARVASENRGAAALTPHR